MSSGIIVCPDDDGAKITVKPPENMQGYAILILNDGDPVPPGYTGLYVRLPA
jgi:hypothetical protein